MTVVDQSLVSLAMHVGRMTARDLDLPAVLSRICTALPAATGVAGAVVLVTEPSDEDPTVVASDAQAGWIGEAQRRAGTGPLPGVARSGRPLRTPDLTRLAPPELALAAAESGLTSSIVVPLVAGTEPYEAYGALQLLGPARRPVEPAQAEAVRPLLAVLVARLVDLRALRRLGEQRAPVEPVRVDATDVATTAIATTVLPAATPAAPANGIDGEATQAVSVPAQRRAPGARHRRVDEPEDVRPPVREVVRPPVPRPNTPEISRPGLRRRPR